jgi:hypothetical protein
MKIRNTAGPSPLSLCASSSPHTSQRSTSVRKPLNRRPSPHRGQRQRHAAVIGETLG